MGPPAVRCKVQRLVLNLSLEDTLGRKPNWPSDGDEWRDYWGDQAAWDSLHSSTFAWLVPHYYASIMTVKAQPARYSRCQEIFQNYKVNLGSLYVNDFTMFGKNFRVTMQEADSDHRSSMDDLQQRDSTYALLLVRWSAKLRLWLTIRSLNDVALALQHVPRCSNPRPASTGLLKWWCDRGDGTM